MINKDKQPQPCPICLHDYSRKQLTRHHLIPKSRKGRVVELVCKPCHKQIHATFNEKELERSYDTIEKLIVAEEFVPWVKWIRRRKPTRKIQVRRNKRRS